MARTAPGRRRNESTISTLPAKRGTWWPTFVELREHRGEWAVVARVRLSSKANATAGYLRASVFEAATRRVASDQVCVYARYVGG